MGATELKTDLHTIIDNIDDKNLLNKVYTVLLNLVTIKPAVDFWDELSAEEKEAIEEGLAQADRGELIPHEEVMKEMRLKYGLK